MKWRMSDPPHCNDFVLAERELRGVVWMLEDSIEDTASDREKASQVVMMRTSRSENAWLQERSDVIRETGYGPRSA
jgi:hypothetical protein